MGAPSGAVPSAARYISIARSGRDFARSAPSFSWTALRRPLRHRAPAPTAAGHRAGRRGRRGGRGAVEIGQQRRGRDRPRPPGAPRTARPRASTADSRGATPRARAVADSSTRRRRGAHGLGVRRRTRARARRAPPCRSPSRVGGLLVEAVGVHAGVPFGAYAYTGDLGAEVLGAPAVVPWLG